MSYLGDNYYARLGVPRDATPADIRRAYHDAARRFHPDVNSDPQAKDHFLKIQEAYEVLSEPDSRGAYDQGLPEEEQGQPISITTRYSRSTLARIQEPQLIYVLLEFQANTDPRTSSQPPINICLVLDRSTSMQGLRLDTLKSTARQLIHQLRPQDYLSIVTFSDRAEVLVPATRGSDYEKIEARISLLQAGGSTEILSGLRAGYQEVSRHLRSSQINHLILITDGRTYGDEEECLRLAERARDEGITINGLGIGSEWNDEFVDNLVGMTGGSSKYVASSEDIRRFLEEIFLGLGRIFAERVALQHESDAGVELKYAFRLEPDAGPLSSASEVVFGNIQADEKLAVLLEFLVTTVPESADLVGLVRGHLRLDVPARAIPAVRLPVLLERPTSAVIDPEPPPPAIVKALSRLTLYRMQEKARNDADAGNFEEATRVLKNLATQLLAHGEGQLARTVLLEVNRLQNGQPLSEQGEKRIKYGTRALLLPKQLEDIS